MCALELLQGSDLGNGRATFPRALTAQRILETREQSAFSALLHEFTRNAVNFLEVMRGQESGGLRDAWGRIWEHVAALASGIYCGVTEVLRWYASGG